MTITADRAVATAGGARAARLCPGAHAPFVGAALGASSSVWRSSACSDEGGRAREERGCAAGA